MKRLAKIAKTQGVEMHVKEGGSHTKVTIGDRSQMVPRHNEVNEMTAKAIIQAMEES
jgi:hypothetical protein